MHWEHESNRYETFTAHFLYRFQNAKFWCFVIMNFTNHKIFIYTSNAFYFFLHISHWVIESRKSWFWKKKRDKADIKSYTIARAVRNCLQKTVFMSDLNISIVMLVEQAFHQWSITSNFDNRLEFKISIV